MALPRRIRSADSRTCRGSRPRDANSDPFHRVPNRLADDRRGAVGVLEEGGTIDFLGQLITVGGSPLLLALAAAYIGGSISAFASTAGVLGAGIPLTVPCWRRACCR